MIIMIITIIIIKIMIMIMMSSTPCMCPVWQFFWSCLSSCLLFPLIWTGVKMLKMVMMMMIRWYDDKMIITKCLNSCLGSVPDMCVDHHLPTTVRTSENFCHRLLAYCLAIKALFKPSQKCQNRIVFTPRLERLINPVLGWRRWWWGLNWLSVMAPRWHS